MSILFKSDADDRGFSCFIELAISSPLPLEPGGHSGLNIEGALVFCDDIACRGGDVLNNSILSKLLMFVISSVNLNEDVSMVDGRFICCDWTDGGSGCIGLLLLIF